MTYCTESDVYDVSGYTSAQIQSLTGKTEAQVSALISSFISYAERSLKGKIKSPIIIIKEKHVGDGKTNAIELGPRDETFGLYKYDPSNCVEEVFAVFDSGGKRLTPYPKDCDEITEQKASSYATSNATVTDEASIVKCGSYSIKIVFSDAGYIAYPSTADLNKNVYPYDYIGFWFRSSDSTAKFTLKLYDKDGNHEDYSFTVDKENMWQYIRIYFEKTTVSWDDEPLYQIRIASDKACTCYFDNFNFNDGWWWTYPEGLLIYGKVDSDGEGDFAKGDIVKVTYSFDPYKVSTPAEVKECCALMAAERLIDHLIGLRQMDTAFVQETDTLGIRQDRETLERTKERFRQRIDELLSLIGYGFYSGAT